MDAKAFCDWMERMNFNNLEASAALGISRNTVPTYRKEGAPLTVALACAALSYGLKPMGEPRTPVEDTAEEEVTQPA